MTPEQFQAVFREYLAPISKYLARRVEGQFIEDLASDVFAIAWQKRDQIPKDFELPWLYRTARYVVSNHRRKGSVTAKFLASLAAPVAAPSAEHLALAEMGLEQAWSKLDANEQEILSLSAFEGLSSKEIARVVESSENAVNIRLSRVRKKFADYLKES